MNSINISGRLCFDPDFQTTTSGTQVCKFVVAVPRKFNREETDFFPVTTWKGLAENCSKYLAKGSQVGISGSIQIRNFEDKNGIKKIAVEIIADNVDFLTRTAEVSPSTAQTIPNAKEIEGNPDLPF